MFSVILLIFLKEPLLWLDDFQLFLRSFWLLQSNVPKEVYFAVQDFLKVLLTKKDATGRGRGWKEKRSQVWTGRIGRRCMRRLGSRALCHSARTAGRKSTAQSARHDEALTHSDKKQKCNALRKSKHKHIYDSINEEVSAVRCISKKQMKLMNYDKKKKQKKVSHQYF